jgi:hypothetical protein
VEERVVERGWWREGDGGRVIERVMGRGWWRG